MKEFSISVKIVGDEYYTVQAETFDEAVKLIKEGKVDSEWNEFGWSSEFYLDDEEEI